MDPTPAVRDSTDRETGLTEQLDWGKVAGLDPNVAVLPVVLQDRASGEVLFVAWITQQALRLSLEEGTAVLWSTSRNELWRKGATSGDELALHEVRVNCEQNSLLFIVDRRQSGACHVRDQNGATRPNCYFRTLDVEGQLAFG